MFIAGLGSVCCKSSYKSFGSVLSKTTICSNFIGPLHSVEGAVASLSRSARGLRTTLAGHSPMTGGRRIVKADRTIEAAVFV